LTDALGYAQQHRRAYQTAKEDLYLSALALTLERHLWTPQFSGSLRGVYGNYGEIRDFDQATRFVAELGVSQRLPYGGEFTAQAVSTLIRDVKKSITASEGSTASLTLDIPLLRGAGHVAQEDLIQLERSLTYAVRRFEEFRREQLVDVAQQYFSLLADKQAVLDSEASLQSANELLERERAFQRIGKRNALDVARVETRVLSEENNLARQRESFRSATDRFKILIGMPVAEPIGLEDVETIEAIEAQVAEGKYPQLLAPPAADDEERAIDVAKQYRLDLLTQRDEIEDARRGVAIARNNLLPDLDWSSSLTFDTDPNHYNAGAFEVARANWRSEVLLSINDRFRERNAYRTSLIDVRRAQRSYTDAKEQVVAEVLSAVNRIRLQDETVAIQRRNLELAQDRQDQATYMWQKGKADNRDLVEAQQQYVDAQNALNGAKTARWSALLQFRLATDTLRVDETGVQHADPTAAYPADAD
jgi:outer membrane protein TolC